MGIEKVRKVLILSCVCLLLSISFWIPKSHAVLMDIISGAYGYIDVNLPTDDLDLFDVGTIDIYIEGMDPTDPLTALVQTGHPSETQVIFWSDDWFLFETGEYVDGIAFFECDYITEPYTPGHTHAFGVNYLSLTFQGFGYNLIAEVPSLDPVPEPATILLIGTGLAGFVGFRRKFRKG